ncbi:MAG: hypothetical protein GY765_13885 [bacterium]|nr:hypothetical protein [bacterium]
MKKNFAKTLTLNKSTVTNLDSRELQGANGGTGENCAISYPLGDKLSVDRPCLYTSPEDTCIEFPNPFTDICR